MNQSPNPDPRFPSPASGAMPEGRGGAFLIVAKVGWCCAVWFLVLNPWFNVWFLFPAAFTAGLAALAADRLQLRIACLFVTVLGSVAFFLLACLQFPFLVVADSDLGLGARARSADSVVLCFLSLTVVGVIFSGLLPWIAVRLAVAGGVVAAIIVYPFESADTPLTLRWALMVMVGVLIADEAVPVFQARIPRWLPLGSCGWLIVVPALLVLADWQGRVCLGLLPSLSWKRVDNQHVSPGDSVSIINDSTSRDTVSTANGLRATVDEHGHLLVRDAEGGPPFRWVPERDRLLRLLLFSPDGKTLAVADNHRMGRGSRVAVWGVEELGGPGQPPRLTLRHELGEAEYGYFSLAFFPDGRTLVSSNGDNSVCLWDAATGQRLASFVAYPRPESWDLHAGCVAASPDGRTFATWALDGIKVWDRESLRLLRSMGPRGAIPTTLAFTPDGKALIAADRETVSRWDLAPSPMPLLGLVAGLAASVGWTIRQLGRLPRGVW